MRIDCISRMSPASRDRLQRRRKTDPGLRFEVLECRIAPAVLGGAAPAKSVLVAPFAGDGGGNAATSTTPDLTPVKTAGTAAAAVQAQADLAISFLGFPTFAYAGSNIDLRVGFTNYGPSDATTWSISYANLGLQCPFVALNHLSGPTTGSAFPVGAQSQYDLILHVPSNAPNLSSTVNTVSISGSPTDPNFSNNSYQAITEIRSMPGLSLTMTDSPDPVYAGTNLIYTLTLTDTITGASGATVSDPLPANTTFVAAGVTSGRGWYPPMTPPVGGTGAVTFFNNTGIFPGESATFTIVVHVAPNTPDGTNISNNAVAYETPIIDYLPTFAFATTSVINHTDLSVTQSVSSDPVIAGNDLTYTLTFANNGPVTAQAVTVSDPLPANTTFVSAGVKTGGGWSISAPGVGGTGKVVFSKSAVAAGEAATFTVVLHVSPGAPDESTITNVATVSSSTTDPNSPNDVSSVTTTVLTSADLGVAMTDSPDPVIAGNDLTYTLTFANNGPVTAQAVTVSDPLPANTTFVSAGVKTGGGWSISAPGVGGTGKVVFSKSAVAAGEAATFTVVLHVSPGAADESTITNVATASSSTTDPNSPNDVSSVTTAVLTSADLGVAMTDAPDPVIAGTDLTYTITFANGGPSDAQGAAVTDPLPANTTFVSAAVASGSGWAISAPGVGDGGSVVFSKGTAPFGDAATFTIVVRVNSSVPNGSAIRNTVTAASATSDPAPSNDSATGTAPVRALADVGLADVGLAETVSPGGHLVYTLTVTNGGPSDAQNVTLIDSAPAAALFASASQTSGPAFSVQAPGVGQPGGVIWRIAALPAGATAVFVLEQSVGPLVAAGTPILNWASVSTTTAESSLDNDRASAASTVVASLTGPVKADLAVTASASPAPTVVAGGNLTYRVTVLNLGPGDAINVVLNEAFPAGTSLVSASQTGGPTFTAIHSAVAPQPGLMLTAPLLPRGGSATFTVVLHVDPRLSGATLTGAVQVVGATPDPNLANNVATTQSIVVPALVSPKPAGALAQASRTDSHAAAAVPITAATAAVEIADPSLVDLAIEREAGRITEGRKLVSGNWCQFNYVLENSLSRKK